jgi:hypothetical protein
MIAMWSRPRKHGNILKGILPEDAYYPITTSTYYMIL